MKRQFKKLMIFAISATMLLSAGGAVYVASNALPNGTMTNQGGTTYLTDSSGEKYSGWFLDSNGDWYYLNSANGKKETGWKTIDGKEYFFPPVRDMGNYHFNSEQEKCLYQMNSKGPYGARYENTITSNGKKVNSDGGLILVNSSLTAKEKSIILTIIAEEIGWKSPSYITHNYIDKSEFTLEHVRNAFYQFGSEYGIADYYDWVKDRKKQIV